MVPAKRNTSTKKPKRRVIRPHTAQPPHWLGWLVVGLLCAGIIAAIVAYQRRLRHYDAVEQTVTASAAKGKLVAYPGRTIDYKRHFNHQNAKHLAAAQAKGLPKPPKDEADIKNYRSKLVKINTCKNYVVDDLTHSVPYLTKGAAKTLDIIADDFSDILERNGLPHYRFIVTSVLRTDDSVRQLRKSGNINASENSAHRYGTTFDITYKRFDKADITADYMDNENLKLVLGQALLNAQRAGLVYVKYEYKQACFHITSRQ